MRRKAKKVLEDEDDEMQFSGEDDADIYSSPEKDDLDEELERQNNLPLSPGGEELAK